MTIESLIKLVGDSSLGLISFAALLYGMLKASAFAKELLENHLVHIVEGLTRINEKLEIVGDKLDELIKKNNV